MAAVAKQSPGKSKGRIVAKYDYTDNDGALLYQVLRLEPKSFQQRRPTATADGLWQLGDRRVIYRWAELLKYPDATVFPAKAKRMPTVWHHLETAPPQSRVANGPKSASKR